MASRSRQHQQLIEHRAHAAPMRSLPEYAVANVACAEAIVVSKDGRGQHWCHLCLVDRTQGCVAMQTQRERPGAARQVTAINDLAELLGRSPALHTGAVRDAPPLEQITITRQHDAAFGAA